MADDPTTGTTGTPAEPGAGAGEPTSAAARPAPRPSPRASAASRARRIGGAPRAGTVPPPPTGKPEGPPAAGAGVELEPDRGATGSHRADPGTETDVETDAGADVGADVEAGSEAEAGTERADVPVWLTWAPAAILVAGAVAMAVIVAIVSHGVWWGKDTTSQASVNRLRQQVSAAAKTCLAATNTYKYTDIDAFERAGTACTTGTQTKQFRTAVDTLIRKNAPKLKFSQTAQINKAAIESVSGNQWTLLLYGQLAVTNVNTPSGRTDPFAAIVRMEKVHGAWLISSLRTVSSPVN